MTKTIKPGMSVIDSWGHTGVIVYIVPGHTNEDHGVIAVWQSKRTSYGEDNCEHYPFHNWTNILTITNKNTDELTN